MNSSSNSTTSDESTRSKNEQMNHQISNNSNNNDSTTGSKSPTEKVESQLEEPVSRMGPRPACFTNSASELLFVATAVLSQILNISGTTQTLTLFKILATDLNTTSNMESWLMASFSLVTGSLILISGQLGDIYGLKKVLICGYIFSFIWSLILGFTKYTHQATFFIVSRAFQGLGVSCILPNVMGIVGTIYQAGSNRKNLVFALIGAGAPIGAVLGVWWASLIVHFDKHAWSWCFWAYAILTFLTLILNILFCPNGIPKNTKNIKMDWIGALLAVVGLVLFNFSWNQGAIVGFQTHYIIALLVISVVAIVSFFIYEKDYALYPLVPKTVFLNPNVVAILATLLFGWGSFGCFLFYLFQTRLYLQNMDPLLAGTEFIPFAIFGIIAALTVALTIKKLTAQVLLTFSSIAFCAGSVMLAILPLHQIYWKLSFFTTIILSFGMDLSFPAASIVLSDNLPKANQGMAGSLISTMMNYSMSLFLGVAGVVQSQVGKNIENNHPEYSEQKKTQKTYRAAMYFAIGSAGLAIVISSSYAIATLVFHKDGKNTKVYESKSSTQDDEQNNE
ncbi:hypothetical protein ACO0QE_004611 [Hanseniaspora vineae]